MLRFGKSFFLKHQKGKHGVLVNFFFSISTGINKKKSLKNKINYFVTDRNRTCNLLFGRQSSTPLCHIGI